MTRASSARRAVLRSTSRCSECQNCCWIPNNRWFGLTPVDEWGHLPVSSQDLQDCLFLVHFVYIHHLAAAFSWMITTQKRPYRGLLCRNHLFLGENSELVPLLSVLYTNGILNVPSRKRLDLILQLVVRIFSTDAQLEWSQILTPTKSAVWSSFQGLAGLNGSYTWQSLLTWHSRHCLTWLAAPSFRQYYFNHTLDLIRRFVLTMPCGGHHWSALLSAFLVHWVWRCDDLVMLSSLRIRR